MRLSLAMLAVLAVTSAPPAFAGGCDEGELGLMGCEVPDKNLNFDGTGWVLCGAPRDERANSFTALHYIYDKSGTREFSYPPDPNDGKDHFFSHHYKERGLYRFRIRFESGPYTYQIYMNERPPPSDPGEAPSVDSGVRVYKGKKIVSDRACGEDPRPYLAYIMRSTACDMKNPLGRKACVEDHVPELK